MVHRTAWGGTTSAQNRFRNFHSDKKDLLVLYSTEIREQYGQLRQNQMETSA